MSSNRPLGSIASFTISHRAGYAYVARAELATTRRCGADIGIWTPSCWVRAAYCDSPKDVACEWKVVLTDRIEGRINLGDGVTRSLKGSGIPDGATVQVRKSAAIK